MEGLRAHAILPCHTGVCALNMEAISLWRTDDVATAALAAAKGSDMAAPAVSTYRPRCDPDNAACCIIVHVLCPMTCRGPASRECGTCVATCTCDGSPAGGECEETLPGRSAAVAAVSFPTVSLNDLILEHPPRSTPSTVQTHFDPRTQGGAPSMASRGVSRGGMAGRATRPSSSARMPAPPTASGPPAPAASWPRTSNVVVRWLMACNMQASF